MTTNTLALNAQHDIYIDSNGILAVVKGADSILQNVVCILQLWLGEAEFDITRGVPYFQIMGQSLTLGEVKALITPVILSVNGVSKINTLNISFDRKTRKMTIDTELTLMTGEIVSASI